jgi:DNA-binding protein Fis
MQDSILRDTGDTVSFSEWNIQSFISLSAANELVRALKGEQQDLQIDTELQLEPALQALQEGASLTDIIQRAVDCLECYLIIQILESTDGNKAETARILKIDYKTLYRKMYKYFGTFSDFGPPAGMEVPSPSIATWLNNMATDEGIDLDASVS